MIQNEHTESHGPSKDDRTLEIIIQSTRGSKKFSFPKETKIADVIAKAVAAFGFARETSSSSYSRPAPASRYAPSGRSCRTTSKTVTF